MTTDSGISKLHQPPARGTWVQTERAAHEALAVLISKHPRAAALLHVLIANMDEKGALITSQTTLAKLTNVSIATTKRALSVLIKGQWIQTIRIGSERGGALAYIVNSRVAWADSRENIKYARFSATVLISSEDQQDLGDGPLKYTMPSFKEGERQLPHGPDEGNVPFDLPMLPMLGQGGISLSPTNQDEDHDQ